MAALIISFRLDNKYLISLLISFLVLFSNDLAGQPSGMKWSDEGNSYYTLNNNQIIKYSLPGNLPATLISEAQLTPEKSTVPLAVSYFSINEKTGKALLMTKSKKVWRLNTRGDFWIFDLNTGKLSQLGKNLPPSSLMFTKISPDGKYAA